MLKNFTFFRGRRKILQIGGLWTCHARSKTSSNGYLQSIGSKWSGSGFESRNFKLDECPDLAPDVTRIIVIRLISLMVGPDFLHFKGVVEKPDKLADCGHVIHCMYIRRLCLIVRV